MKIRLWDYQQRGVKDITIQLLKGMRSIAYVLSTGGGKTMVFSFLARTIARTGKNVTIVVHRRRLVLQSSLALAQIGVRHKLVASKKVMKQVALCHVEQLGKSFVDEKSSISIASVQMLAKRLHLLEDCHMLIIDECHHANIGYWKACITAATKAVVVGVTATLIRMDGRGLGDVFDVHVEGPPMSELIERGRLCRPRVFASKEQIDLSEVRSRKGDYNTDDLAREMDKPYLIGNSVEHYKYLCDKVPAIVYCCNIAHAEHVTREFRQSGYNAVSLTSEESEDEQFRILNQLATGDIDLVMSVDIISEGTDVPLVGCGISLRPTKSLSLWDQQFGRPMRIYPDQPIMQLPHMQGLIVNGQHTSFFLDHAGNSHRHGLPVHGRVWSLKHDAIKRKKESDAVKIVTCPGCDNIHQPMANCPECNHLYQVEEKKLVHVKSGVLVELDLNPNWAEGKNLQEEKLSILLSKAHRLEQLEDIATARGYEYGWVLRHVRMRSEAAQKHKRRPRL
ncbi:MAG: DEAD/DEAH box helicase [Bacteroidota bacterium]